MKSHGRNLVWVFEKLTELRATPSRNKKEEILDEIYKRDKDVLYDILYYANHPFLNYRITVQDELCWAVKIPKADPVEAVWPRFIEALNQMNKGQLSGSKAKKEIESILSPLHDVTRHWFNCIINRDLKMGIAARTITKYFPDLLPEVTPMLAKAIDWNDDKVFESKVGWYWEPKVDGMRALVFVKDRKVTIVSRAGKPTWNTELIEQEILDLGLENAVFDGEFYAGSFAKTISIVHTQSLHKDRGMLKFFVFDIIPWSMWAMKHTHEFSKRRALLEKVLAANETSHVKLVPSIPLKKTNKPIIEKLMQEVMRDGWEGGMLKDPNAKYDWGRSMAWLKVKPVFEGDLEIIGFEEGEGKNAGKLGAWIGKGEVEFFGKTYPVQSRVGGGFSDAQRLEFWLNRNRMMGTIFQSEFKEVALWQGPKKSSYALREPVFVRVREDK